MVELGKYNKLKVVKKLDFGVYLDGEEQGEILLPLRYVPENCEVDDEVEVFIYFDSEDRIIATTEKPLAQVEEFAYLRVVSVNTIGAFLDWGLMKDLLVPFREQKQKMEEGKFYLVFVYLDKDSNRIVASAKLDQFLDNTPPDYSTGQEVDLVIASQTDLGFNAIVNNTHWGMLYKNEVFKPLSKGMKLKGYIKKVREDDKIDLSLNRLGYGKIDDISAKLLKKIEDNGGRLDLTDKSDPELIYLKLNMSKKVFKMAVGALYKERLITITPQGLVLNSQNDNNNSN
ncbi:MAG TPA: S1-like domain-containing RNA-binding protein [Bacteroidales bacterium]|nr:S1-like domain-containing RNA-binding protein [Bacteroidales bacterium]